MTNEEATKTIVEDDPQKWRRVAYEAALNALSKQQDEYRWHDLRKDPKDRPVEENGLYFLAGRVGGNDKIGYDLTRYIQGEGFDTYLDDILKWRKMELVEEDEE